MYFFVFLVHIGWFARPSRSCGERATNEVEKESQNESSSILGWRTSLYPSIQEINAPERYRSLTDFELARQS
jgi:hypothetical protein